MAAFAISDLHLPGGDVKPMEVFGAHWERHFERICEDWRARVEPNDVVLLPGDISWAMYLEDAKPDLEAIGALPGMKILLRGNHDYWWNAISRVRAALPKSVYAIQNDCVDCGAFVAAGSRGWTLPDEQTSAEDEKIYRRERIRMRMALDAASRKADGRPVVALAHFPPLTEINRDTDMTRLFEEFGVRMVVYGHLHGAALRGAFRGEHNGVAYRQVSCDGLGFQLMKLF